MQVNSVFSFQSLDELSREPDWADASGKAFLCLDLRGGALPEADAARLGAWLTDQTVPVVGLVDENRVLHEALDLALTSEAELETVSTAIRQNPAAASVLTRVTRACMELPIPLALAVESLGYATLQGGDEFATWLTGYRESRERSRGTASSEGSPLRLLREGSRLHITLDNPSNRNALSVTMRDALREAFQLVAMDNTIQQVVVAGSGPCFCAGGDLTEFGSCTDTTEAHRIRQARMPAQVLAPHSGRYTFRLHGACIGAGIELPAFAGHIAATRDAFFRLPEVAMGLIPGAGGCVSIPRRIGRHRANWLAISGAELRAEDALEWGLIDEITN